MNKEKDYQLQLLAWQTSLIMNSSGNYKKKIKPTDLYKSPFIKEDETTQGNRLSEDEKQTKLADLKAKFGK